MDKTQVKFALPVSILREGESFIAYTHALDLSTVGSTFVEAKSRFEEAVELFFEEIMANGTMEQVLSDLGWETQNDTMLPPVVVSYLTENFSIPITS